MSPSRPLLILLLLFLNPALGYPVAKRLSHSEISEDVLAGTDFLSVMLKTSPPRSVGPSYNLNNIFGARTRNSDYAENNSVVQKTKESVHLYNHINLKGENVLVSDSDEPNGRSDQEKSSKFKPIPENNIIIKDSMKPNEKNYNDNETLPQTTISTVDYDSTFVTFYDLDEETPNSNQSFKEEQSTNPSETKYWSEQQTYPAVAVDTQTAPSRSTNSSDQPLQVISVRVSSSVVRYTQKVDDPLKSFESEKINKPTSLLITQEQPKNIAIQRSHLDVEEAPIPEDQTTYHEIDERVKLVEPKPSSHVDNFRTLSLNPEPVSKDNGKLLGFYKNIDTSQNNKDIFTSTARTYDEEYEEKAILQTEIFKVNKNLTYQIEQKNNKAAEESKNVFTELKADTSDVRNPSKLTSYQYNYQGRPQRTFRSGFQDNNYFKNENLGSARSLSDVGNQEQFSRSISHPQALAFHYNPPTNPLITPISYHTSVSSATSGSSVQFFRSPPSNNNGPSAETIQREILTNAPKRDFSYTISTPPNPIQITENVEKNYELPEQNYEVDEAISVVTNGRAHGVQIPTPTPSNESPNVGKDDNKSAYVVEGRNFRKYRVEEKTPDGFIVGEYGVVSHDDGSLRGVRYTADSTINPRLIYDALVKFLSLKR